MSEVAKILGEIVRRGRITTVDDMGDPEVTQRHFTLGVFTTDGRVSTGKLGLHSANFMVIEKSNSTEVFIPLSQVARIEAHWHD
jgi:ribosome biogenesis SPOUT family RNA methylase Rps3